MHAEGLLLLRIHGVVPGAGGQLNDAAPDSVRDADAGQAGAARVEEANDVSVRDATGRRVVRVHARNLAPAMLGLGAVPAEIQLKGVLTDWRQQSGAFAGASAGGSQAGCPGQSGSPKLATVEEKTSIRPLGVLRGAPAGSSLKALRYPPSSGSCGNSRPWPAQNSAKLGAGNPIFSRLARVGS
jgi:hypothetical protein